MSSASHLAACQRALWRATANDPATVELDLSNTHMRAAGAKILAQHLKDNTHIDTLLLVGNDIKAEGAVALLELPCANSTLAIVDLTGNDLCDDGAVAIANFLRTNARLRVLLLGSNKIKATGAKALADALCSNTSLWELDLRNNSIKDEGARAMALMLEANSSLRALNLSKSKIQSEGAAGVARALCLNSALTHLDLSNNRMDDNACVAMLSSLTVNSSLRNLDLCGNNNTTLDGLHGLAGHRCVLQCLSINLQPPASVPSVRMGLVAVAEGAQRLARFFAPMPRVALQTDCRELMELLQRRHALPWHPSRHHRFGEQWDAVLRTLMLAMRRLQKGPGSPRLQQLVHNDPAMLEEALEGLLPHDLFVYA